MQGLRTQEESAFCRFFELVQQKAAELGSVFFADSGEGRDFVLDDMEGEDLSGWLIPIDRAAVFQDEWEKGKPADERLGFFRFAVWRMESGALTIDFKDYS